MIKKKRERAMTDKRHKKIKVKRKFANAISRLKQMKPMKQRAAAVGASNEFIRDMSSFFSKIRKRPDLLKAKHRRILRRYRKKMKKLVHAKTPIHSKRLILSQKGGIIPALIPIIVAAIGAGGSVAAAATHAAVSRA